jgi:hypothetical protein
MKWVFIAGFALAILLTLVAVGTMPRPHYDGVTQLVWATDDNPARQEQMQLFRAWHQQHYGQKIDIRIDPANYSGDKIVIQS